MIVPSFMVLLFAIYGNIPVTDSYLIPISRNSKSYGINSKLIFDYISIRKLTSHIYMTYETNGDEPDEDEAFCCETDDFFDDDDETKDTNVNGNNFSNSTAVIENDPQMQLIKLKIDALNLQISQIESLVSFERSSLTKSKDKVSESGKTGFFIVQAQVNDFLVSFLCCLY